MTLNIGEHYSVKVIKIIKVGAIVQIAPEQTELIHLSKIANGFVKDISDFVSVGDVLDAECVQGFNKNELSLKHLNLVSKHSDDNPRVSKVNSRRELYINNQPQLEFYKYEDDEPRVSHKKKRKPKPSIDEMIAAANDVCEDKIRRMNKRNRDRQYKNRNY